MIRLAPLALLLALPAGAQTLDTSFGEDGFAALDPAGPALTVTDVEADAQSRIVYTVNTEAASGGSARVGRLLADGTPDAAYGTAGEAGVDRPGPRESLRRLEIQSDGSVLAAGTAYTTSPNGLQSSALFARISPDGASVQTWVYPLAESSAATDVTSLGGGRVALSVEYGDGSARACGVLVLGAGRAPLPDFGAGGLVRLPFDDCTTAGVEASGGGVAVGGTRESESGDRDLFIVRYRLDGTLDETFGDGGVAARGFDDDEEATDFTRGPSGDLLVSGIGDKGGVTGVVLLRYNSDGTPDSFGDRGFVYASGSEADPRISPLPGPAPSGAIDAAGRVVVVTTTLAPGRLSLLRFRPDGSLDPEFGATAIVQIDAAPSPDGSATGQAVASDARGRIVFAGGFARSSSLQVGFVGRLSSDLVTSTPERPRRAPVALTLGPNPSAARAALQVEVGEPLAVRVRVLDAQGRVLVDERRPPAASHGLTLNTARWASGVYAVVVETERDRAVTRLAVVR